MQQIFDEVYEAEMAAGVNFLVDKERLMKIAEGKTMEWIKARRARRRNAQADSNLRKLPIFYPYILSYVTLFRILTLLRLQLHTRSSNDIKW